MYFREQVYRDLEGMQFVNLTVDLALNYSKRIRQHLRGFEAEIFLGLESHKTIVRELIEKKGNLYDYLTRQLNEMVLNEAYFSAHFFRFLEALQADSQRSNLGNTSDMLELTGSQIESSDFSKFSRVLDALIVLERIPAATVTLQEYVMAHVPLVFKFAIQRHVFDLNDYSCTPSQLEYDSPPSKLTELIEKVFQVYFSLMLYLKERFDYKASYLKGCSLNNCSNITLDCHIIWDYFSQFFCSLFSAITNYHASLKSDAAGLIYNVDLDYLRIWFGKYAFIEYSEILQTTLSPSALYYWQYESVIPLYNRLVTWISRVTPTNK